MGVPPPPPPGPKLTNKLTRSNQDPQKFHTHSLQKIVSKQIITLSKKKLVEQTFEKLDRRHMLSRVDDVAQAKPEQPTSK